MHLTIMIIIAIIALIFLAATVSGNPKTVLQPEYRKVLFIVLCLFMYFSIAFLIIVWGFNRPLQEAPDISISFLLVIVFLIISLSRIQSRQKSGRVLLDIGSIPNKFAYVALAIIFIVIGFVSDFFYFLGAPYARYMSILLGISFAIYFLVTARSRLQIREKGFWVYGYLQKWEKIESLDLHHDENTYALKLKYKGRMPAFLLNSAFTIPSKKKGRLASLLKLHLPNITLTEKSA